jgi:hypothetical protein
VFAYIVGLLTVVGGGAIGLMALNKLTPPVASVAAAASHKERLATLTKPTTVAQKDAQPSQKRKVAHVVRKHKEVAPTNPSGLMRTDTRKNRAVSVSTRLSFLAVSKSGAKMTATGGDNLNPCPSA